ncbi:MarR family winged helix-turn-helix transcriptional regulator [Ferrimonas lipolytica]|uniref:MarR family transcriptional regulator n=1 Tax=Ferrimonas lipolytica TaxID=2724191 RepID=A0A6H1UAW2_9GAMM|nr:MarR family transcriptional regulator [Ferrimonas lipolytica]QIZ76191.1 MarR family transcriptional regulator [Ferrimonas lipolytica]
MTTSDSSAQLLLENQLCFPLYSAANAVTRAYRPLLKALDLTYPQYLVMMLLWQHQQLNVTELGHRLYLDSGTLTPLLKRLEAKGLISRRRCQQDERVRLIDLTAAGAELKTAAAQVPELMRCKVTLQAQELQRMKMLCQQLLADLN